MRFTGALRATIAILGVLAGVLLAIALLRHGSSALRPGDPVSMLEDESVLSDPARGLQTLRSLGVERLRLSLTWSALAPDATSPSPPRGFRASDPAAYSPSAWRPYDAVVKDAHADGIEVDWILTGSAPRWAMAPNATPAELSSGAWKPSAAAYGHFVRAVATRYDGAYTPPGSSSPLPRVDFWEIWNEPNWGPSLQPQMALHPLRIVSAPEYRRLADSAWRSLSQTGHGHDTIVIGNLSPRGVTVPPDTKLAAAVDVSGPFAFTRTLYCVDSSDRPLRGAGARRVGCPTTAAGSNHFAHAHPALFDASGFGVHPYPIGLPPTEADESGGDTVEFSQIPQFANLLDRLHRIYGSHQRPPIYNTEFGYITDPPNPGTEYVSPRTAARYLNWAEYLTWRNPRIATTMQFFLYDRDAKTSVFGPGGFASGLIASDGKPKATFYAYRMPIFLPVTRSGPIRALEVWGAVRPARYAFLDTHQPQYVGIQFRTGSSGPFRTVKTVRITDPRGYFDVKVRFPASGTVRLKWSYPPGDVRLRDPVTPNARTIYSRNVQVTIEWWKAVPADHKLSPRFPGGG
jgi:hypothetical protein